MSRRLNGNFPLAYMGVRPTTPPQVVVNNRPPTTQDIAGFTLADEWLYVLENDPTKSVKYTLCSVESGVAIWVPLNGTSGSIVLPDHSVALGTGAEGLNSVGPDGATGLALISQGSSLDPIFGTVVVAGGGTGDTSFTPFAPICGGTSSTGPLQSADNGINNYGYVLTSNGDTMLPDWKAPTNPDITFDADSGSAIPSSNILNIVGAGNITTSATGNTVTIDGSSIDSGFNSIVVQTFEIAGSYTYTPTTDMSYCIVEVLGAGAGGGAVPINLSNFAGSGGGAGGYCKQVFSAATIGVSQSITIGAGGSPGTNGNNTTFGSLLTGNGGSAGLGTFGAASGCLAGGDGGSASGGYVNSSGNQGGNANWVGSGIFSTSASITTSGKGADSLYGTGGSSICFYPSAAGSLLSGNNASGNGSGGSGAYKGSSSGSGASGGSGAPGLVIVTEYIV